MKKRFLLACMVLSSMFSAMAITIVPVTSTAGNEVWYSIKCNPRDPAAPLATWLSVLPNDSLIYSVYSGGDEQLWKVVENGTGVALVNKKYGYLNSDARSLNGKPRQRLSTQATMPTTPLRFVPSTGYPTLTWPGWDTKTPGVFIVNNTASLTVSATNTFTVNSFEEAFNLAIYAPASGQYLLVVTNPSWAGNLNSVVLFRSQAEIAAELKLALALALTTANTTYNNSTVGANPGQFTEDDMIGLKTIIDASQDVYNNSASAPTEFTTSTAELYSMLTLFNSKMALPTLSSDASEQWYYIKRVTIPTTTTPYMTSTGISAVINCQALTTTDDQLWKMVQNDTNDGWVFQNKGTGEYINSDILTGAAGAGTDLLTSGTKPIKGLKFKTSTVVDNGVSCFFVENSVGTTVNFRLRHATNVQNNTANNDLNCNWLFIPSEEINRDIFRVAKVTARSLYTTSLANQGDQFGQFSSATLATFVAIISAQEAKDMTTMTQDELTASTTELIDATTAFKCNRDVATLSSLTKIKWFRFVNAMQPPTGYAAGKAMSSNGRILDQKFTYETKDVNSDAQLFRFELNTDKTAATTIVNKANSLYVGFNGTMVATPTIDVEFQITGLDNATFWIKPTTASPLHAAASGVEILNWNSSIGSASAWKIEFVKEEDVTDFTAPYLSARTTARAKYEAVLLVSGIEIGQYSSASVLTFNTVLTTEEAKDAATLTPAQQLQGIMDLEAAIAALVINNDIKLLVSTTPNTVKWFRLINGAATSVTYASGKAMSSNGRLVAEPFTFEDKDVTSLNQLFKFELNGDQTKVSNMVNNANSLYMAADGLIATTSTAGNEFEITQLAGGRSFWIHPTVMDVTDPANPYRLDPLHAAAAGTMILNWNSGVGSASAWIFEFVKEETTAVKNVQAFTYKVNTLNNIITVDGVENFEVYSAIGQKQNINKALISGVYFVKVNNAVKKVVID